MIKFILKSILFGLFAAIVLYLVLSAENGNADPFHLKLTGPKQQSLILGNSKAAQGLIPYVLDSNLIQENSNFFNFSFGHNMSSYGPVYLKSIKEKLDPKTQNGKFIITVDAWSLIADKNNPNDENSFPEWDLPLADIKCTSWKPNFKYMLNWYPYPNYEILLRKWRPANEILHPNGWLEVNVPMGENDQEWRLKEKHSAFYKLVIQNELSNKRIQYLSAIIELLINHGTVYLVRIPSHPTIMELENILIPNLNGLLDELALRLNVDYLDLSEKASEFTYTDGVHLHKTSSKSLSQHVGSWMRQL